MICVNIENIFDRLNMKTSSLDSDSLLLDQFLGTLSIRLKLEHFFLKSHYVYFHNRFMVKAFTIIGGSCDTHYHRSLTIKSSESSSFNFFSKF